MTPGREKYYRGLFLVAAVYDTVLGVVFTCFFRQAFSLLGIEAKLPDFAGYVSLIGAFLFVIGIAYFLICCGDLERNRDLILVGTLYKLAYCSVAFFYLVAGTIPHPAFAVVFGLSDLIFFVLMLECLMHLRKAGKRADATV